MDAVSIQAEVGANLTRDTAGVVLNGSTITTGDVDTLTLPENAEDVYVVCLNGEQIEQATTETQLTAKGVVRWAIDDGLGSGTDNYLVFKADVLQENDVVRVQFQPTNEPSWETDYQLTSNPGDQGALYKGEVDIRLITDTTLSRVVEGLELSDANSGTTATLTDTTIAFVDSNPDTITDTNSGFVTAGFAAGMTINVSGSTSNDGTYTIDSVAAGTITLVDAEELTAEAAGASITISTVAEITVSPGACYLKIDDSAGDFQLNNTVGVELFRLTASTNLTLDSADEYSLIYAKPDPFGNMEISAVDAATVSAAEEALTTNTLLQDALVLGLVDKEVGGITSVTDCREFHANTLSLIQTASYSVDMAREIIFELGNKRAVSRTLNKPVNVTVDFSAKDTDEELHTLIHLTTEITEVKTDEEDSSSAIDTIDYTDTTVTIVGTTPGTGDDWEADIGAEVGDIIEARGSFGVIKSFSGANNDTATVAEWFGGTPLDGSSLKVREGILCADQLSDKIGIQVNLYTNSGS
jgi:hypothetical protein